MCSTLFLIFASRGLVLVADGTRSRGRSGTHGESNNLGFIGEEEPGTSLRCAGGHGRCAIGSELQVSGGSCSRGKSITALHSATQDVIDNAVGRQSGQGW